jgi:hypothetical protein
MDLFGHGFYVYPTKLSVVGGGKYTAEKGFCPNLIYAVFK